MRQRRRYLYARMLMRLKVAELRKELEEAVAMLEKALQLGGAGSEN